MHTPTLVQSQLLATKFFVPVAVGPLIARPRLTTLLDESLKHPLTVISAPAGFGKTTLLSTWAQSAHHTRVCWITLDAEDNDPYLFWTYVISALQMQAPQSFGPLLTLLQSQPPPSLKFLLTKLINLLAESTHDFVLILDDYQFITEEQVHTTLLHLVEHMPHQLRVILVTRSDPPWPLGQLRARQQVLEVRTNQLCCTVQETGAFFQKVIGIVLPEEIIQEMTTRTEGWLVGLQLLGLSLPEQADPAMLLQEVSGDQHYILDYLTETVLRQQSQEVQRFLLSTSILERLNASLCDAVTEQTGSQQMLHQLEQANLFVVSLDNKREWYRYHGLFAEALRSQLQHTRDDLIPLLHHRASLWYAQHNQTTEAILHALRAKEWQWAADLVERKSLALNTLGWGVNHYQLLLLRDWLKQIPADVIAARPSLSLARIWMLMFITPQTVLATWLNEVEATLTDALTRDAHQEGASPIHVPQTRQALENMLGEAITYRAFRQRLGKDAEAALPLCERAQALLSANNFGARSHLAVTRLFVSYASSVNDAPSAIQMGLQAGSLNQTTGNIDQGISIMGLTAMHMIGTGRLHETQQLVQQAILLGSRPGAVVLPIVGWPTVWQAEILREWNKLDVALSRIEEAIRLCQQIEWIVSPVHLCHGYAILLRISLSRGNYDAASSALQEIERIGKDILHQPDYIYVCSHSVTIDQVKLWLARGKLDRATRWAKDLDLDLDLKEWRSIPFIHEREEVARARIFMATGQPDLALQRLEPVLQRASAAQRWGHVIEIRLLQALAYQMCHQMVLALDTLSEAIRLAEPEGYVRSFLDEGTSMETLLYQLRKRERKHGPTPYLDMLLAAFQQESTAQIQTAELDKIKVQPLPEPLSEREVQVLQLLAHGASNQEIAQELVIAIDTVKRHVSHIFAKLGVQNRIQAVVQAQALGLLS